MGTPLTEGLAVSGKGLLDGKKTLIIGAEWACYMANCVCVRVCMRVCVYVFCVHRVDGIARRSQLGLVALVETGHCICSWVMK